MSLNKARWTKEEVEYLMSSRKKNLSFVTISSQLQRSHKGCIDKYNYERKKSIKNEPVKNDIDNAISILKNAGYKVFKPIIDYKEI